MWRIKNMYDKTGSGIQTAECEVRQSQLIGSLQSLESAIARSESLFGILCDRVMMITRAEEQPSQKDNSKEPKKLSEDVKLVQIINNNVRGIDNLNSRLENLVDRIEYI
jgi:hypothetical protein